jgi:hypothetical protein
MEMSSVKDMLLRDVTMARRRVGALRGEQMSKLQRDLFGVKGIASLCALALAGWFLVMSDLARAAADPGQPCNAGAPEPPPAHPLPAYSARDIAAMFVPSRTGADVLSNLKIVLDRRLLAQPSFFEEDVLRVLFNTTDVQWVKPGTPDVASERLVKPTRIARIRFEQGGSFAGIKVDVGFNHKCLERRAHPSRSDTLIPSATYDSGYIFIRLDEPATITSGQVRQAFGWNFGELDRECRSPLSMYYPGPEGPARDAFWLHAATFRPSAVGYPQLCRAGPDRGLPDDHPISDIWIRLVENDYTLAEPINP